MKAAVALRQALLIALIAAALPHLAAGQSAPTVVSPACLTMLETQTHHLGDEFIAGWEVPAPEGTVWMKTFDLHYPDSPVVLRLEVFDVDGAFNDSIRINGQKVLHLQGTGGGKWQFQAVAVERYALMAQGNKIRIEVGGSSDKDDILFRNVGLVTCYSIIDSSAHHLGDSYVEYWLIPTPEGITWSQLFQVGDTVPPQAMISFDVYDLSTPPTSIVLNGQAIGTISGANSDTWELQTVIFDGVKLRSGTNTLTVIPGRGSSEWDDIVFKNVRIYYETRPTSAAYLPNVLR
jgi:hypothetical protein